MKNISLDLSHKLPPLIVAFLRRFNEIAGQTGATRFFLVGAQARDFILRYGYGIEPRRLTTDLDFGVAMASWADFQKLCGGLTDEDDFAAVPNIPHRFSHNTGTLFDLVPFGDLENPPGTIAWPPDGTFQMQTIGLAEAYEHALEVQYAPGATVRVASLAGLALLKLVAWQDRRAERDAADLGLIMDKYLDAGNDERLLGENAEHADLLEDKDFDYGLASARVVGRDLAALLAGKYNERITQLLNQATDRSGDWCLVMALVRHNANFHGDEEAAWQMLCALRRGFNEAGGIAGSTIYAIMLFALLLLCGFP